jgi:hypothetical protein
MKEVRILLWDRPGGLRWPPTTFPRFLEVGREVWKEVDRQTRWEILDRVDRPVRYSIREAIACQLAGNRRKDGQDD